MSSIILLKQSRCLLSFHTSKYIANTLLFKSSGHQEQQRSAFSNDVSTSVTSNLLFPENKHKTNERADKISKAMLYYLEKLTEREKLMKVKTEEYEIGKRHLAKMMGESPDTFNQEDVDRAIEYLMPSGIFNKKARPFLTHPESYYPKSKIAKFNKDGRPISHLFYTGQSELYQLTYEATQKLINLKKIEDATLLIAGKVGWKKYQNDESLNKIDLSGQVWIDAALLANRLDCRISEADFEKFIILLKKLADHPLSMREEPFLKDYLKPFVPPIKMSDILEPMINENGKKYQEIETSLRTAAIKLKLIEGTGNVKINSPTEGEYDISYFKELIHKQQILFPFKVVDRVNKYDLEIVINEGGMSCLAKGIRYAVSKALCSFVSADNIEKLRLAGLLTKDIRLKERKKYGKEGARRAYTWKKR